MHNLNVFGYTHMIDDYKAVAVVVSTDLKRDMKMKKYLVALAVLGIIMFTVSTQNVCFAENWQHAGTVREEGELVAYYLDLDSCYLLPDSYYGKVCNAVIKIELVNDESWGFDLDIVYFSNQRCMKMMTYEVYDADGNCRGSRPSDRQWVWLDNSTIYFTIYQMAWANAYER